MNKIDVVDAVPERRQLVLGGLAALGLAACKSPDLKGGAGEFSEATLRDSDVVPASTDPSRRTRVVVMPTDDSPSARGAGLAAVASSTLETILGTGGVEVAAPDALNDFGRCGEELGIHPDVQFTGEPLDPDPHRRTGIVQIDVTDDGL